MLIDLDIDYAGKFNRIDTGMYVALDLMAEFELIEFRGHDVELPFYQYSHEWPELKSQTEAIAYARGDKYIQEYGSCTSPQQFAETDIASDIRNSKFNFIVIFTHMRQEDYPDYRWHKNGGHYGTLTPQYEHFGNEPVIKEIYRFHAYRKKDKQ